MDRRVEQTGDFPSGIAPIAGISARAAFSAWLFWFEI